MTSIRNLLRGGVATASILLAMAGGAGADTLGDAMVKAYRNSGLLEQNRALLRAADEDVAGAIASLRPILSYTANVGASRTGIIGGTPSNRSDVVNETTTASLEVSASLLIYDGGQSLLGVAVAKEAVLATRQALRDAEQTILLNAVSAYMRVRSNSQIVSLQQNNLRVLNEELRAARERFEVGEITRTDVALAEAAVATSRSDLVAAQGALLEAQAAYISAVGEEAAALAAPGAFPVATASLQEALDIAMRTHPDILASQHDVAQSELSIQIAQQAKGPTASLTGSLRTSHTLLEDTTSHEGDVTNTASVGIRVTGPIYSGGALSSAQRRAMAARDAQRAGLHVNRLTVEQAVREAYSQLRSARAALEAADERIRATTVAFRGVREEAALGARTTLDVLDAEQDLLDARANRISAVSSEYIAAYTLLSSMGLLTVDYLKLDVPQYDAEGYYNLVKTAPVPISKQGKQLDKVLRGIGKY